MDPYRASGIQWRVKVNAQVPENEIWIPDIEAAQQRFAATMRAWNERARYPNELWISR